VNERSRCLNLLHLFLNLLQKKKGGGFSGFRTKFGSYFRGEGRGGLSRLRKIATGQGGTLKICRELWARLVEMEIFQQISGRIGLAANPAHCRFKNN